MTSPLLEVVNLQKLFPIGGSGPIARRLGLGAEPKYLHAVDEVSFSIARGESLGLVGESGCGKSTLVRLIARLIDPTGGAVRLQGTDLTETPAGAFARHRLRRAVQVVFQDPTESLNPRFTAADSIAEPIRLLSPPGDERSLAQRVRETATLVGFPEELLGRFPHQLSGGQKARVNIARAIALQPALLILDEPTSALDVSVQAVVLRLLDELRRRLDMSYLFVSHDLNVVRLLCQRVVVMYLGKVVEVGPVEQVFQSPRHPYTRALIDAIPGKGPGGTRLSGEPRSPIDPDPSTCRFYGRCPLGHDRCTREMPLLRTIDADHQVACHTPHERQHPGKDRAQSGQAGSDQAGSGRAGSDESVQAS